MCTAIKRELSNMSDKLDSTIQCFNQMRMEKRIMKKKGSTTKDQLSRELEMMQEMLEKLEKDTIRNNVIITGVKEGNRGKRSLKITVENTFKEEMKAKVVVKKAYAIGNNTYVVEMES